MRSAPWSAYPDANADVVMLSGMCGSLVDVDPEVALRELVSALPLATTPRQDSVPCRPMAGQPRTSSS